MADVLTWSVTIIFRGFFLILKKRTKSDRTWMFLACSSGSDTSRVNVLKLEVYKESLMKALDDIYSRTLHVNIQMDAVRPGKNFLANFLTNNGDGNNANEILKSANSSSKLSNKGCPLICIKDQTMPIWIFLQAGESGPNNFNFNLI